MKKIRLSRETLSRIIIGIVFIIVASCVATKTYSNAIMLNDLKSEIGGTVKHSTEQYLSTYVEESGLIPNDTIGMMSEELSGSVVRTLKGKNFTENEIALIEKSVDDVMDKYIGNLNLTDAEKSSLRQNLMAVIMSNIYKSMIDNTFVTQESLDTISEDLDSRVAALEKELEDKNSNLNQTLSKIEMYEKQSKKAEEAIDDIEKLNKDLDKLKSDLSSGNLSGSSMSSISADIKKLQDGHNSQDTSLTALSNQLSKLSLEVNNNGSTSAYDVSALQNSIKNAQDSLNAMIKANEQRRIENEKQIAELNNAYNKYLLEYQNFRNDTNNSIAQVKNEINQTVNTNIENLNNTIINTKNTLTSDLNSKTSQLSNDLDTAKTEMSTDLNNAKTQMSNDLTSTKNSLTNDLNTAKQELNDQINNIGERGYMIGTWSEEDGQTKITFSGGLE